MPPPSTIQGRGSVQQGLSAAYEFIAFRKHRRAADKRYSFGVITQGIAMNPAIASLQERMSKGGDWHAFRDEIAVLHGNATTEDEYVTLLEAHKNLVAVGQFAYDDETYARLLPIAAAEYRMFLNKEAMENGLINPALLERITRREVEAGRLDPNDDFRQVSVGGAAVLGHSREVTAHRCKQGDWFFYGVAVAATLSAGLALVSLSPFWLIALGLVVGWYINERERKRSR